MDRADLLERLGIARPALFDKDSVPLYQCFCLTGTRALAWNDRIGMSVPVETVIQGAVPGGILYDILGSTQAEQVNITMDPKSGGKGVVVAAGNGMRTKLPLEPVKDYMAIVAVPKRDPKSVLSIDFTRFARAVDGVMRSVAGENSSIDSSGVTLFVTKSVVEVCCTDHTTLSRDCVPIDPPRTGGDFRVLLSYDFCKQVLELGRRWLEIAFFELRSDHAMFRGETEDAPFLFGGLLATNDPFDFHRIMNSRYPIDAHKRTVPVPNQLAEAVRRALIMTSSARDNEVCTIDVTNHPKNDKQSVLSISSTGAGENVDRINIARHPEVTCRVKPKALMIGIDAGFARMLVREDSLILTQLPDDKAGTGNHALFLVAATSAV